MKNKRVCIVCNNYNVDEMCLQDKEMKLECFLELGRILSQRNNDVTLLLINDSKEENNKICKMYIDNKIRIIDLEEAKVDFDCDDFTDTTLKASYRVYQYLKTSKFDNIHFNDATGIGFCTIQAKKNTIHFKDTMISVEIDNNTQYTLNKNKMWSSNPLNDMKKIYFEKYCYENADCLILINQELLKWCINNEWILENKKIFKLDEFVEYEENLIFNEEDKIFSTIEHENPLVSVCVTHFNYGKYLPYALKSIKESKYKNYEVIVVDDSSTDKYSIDVFNELRKEYDLPNWKFNVKPNGGAPDAKNYAVSIASGEFLMFVDADNIELPNTINDFLYGIYKKDLDCFTSYFYIFSGEAELTNDNIQTTVVLPGAILELAAIENVFGDSNFIIRKEVFDKLGGFPNERNIYEDWAFLIKLLCLGYKMDVVPIPLFGYRKKEESLSARFNKVESLRATLNCYYQFIPKHLRNLFDIFVAPRNNIF